jgi:hypothetical protein
MLPITCGSLPELQRTVGHNLLNVKHYRGIGNGLNNTCYWFSTCQTIQTQLRNTIYIELMQFLFKLMKNV